MVAEAKKVGPNRYRESYGRYLEDFKVGDVYEHRPGRTISEADNTWFTLLTMNQHPLHFDHEYAAQSEFGQPLVNSCLTLAIVAGMSVSPCWWFRQPRVCENSGLRSTAVPARPCAQARVPRDDISKARLPVRRRVVSFLILAGTS